MPLSRFSPFIRILTRACIALPVVVVLAGTTVSASAETLDGLNGHTAHAIVLPDPAPAAGAQFTEGTAPTIAPGGNATVPMSLTQTDGKTAVSPAVGDVITFTPPPNTTITIPTTPGCPGGFTGPTAIAGGSFTCTARTTTPAWPTSQPISLTVGTKTAGGTYTGGSVTLTSGGTVLATTPITFNVSPTAQITQASVPSIPAGQSGPAPMTLTQVDGSTAVPFGAGDVISFAAPSNTTITGIPSCPGTVAIAANGRSATCTATSAGTWPTSMPVTVAVNAATAGGAFSNGTMTLTTAGGTKMATSSLTVTVPVNVVITQTSVPTISAGSSGSVPMTMFQADGSTNVI
jgi:hypothetical protein